MQFIYYINISLSVLLIFWPLLYTKYFLKIQIINPFTLAWSVMFPVDLMINYGGPALLIDDWIDNDGYQLAIAMNNLKIISGFFSMIFFYKILIKVNFAKYLMNFCRKFKNINYERVGNYFILLYIILFCYISGSEYGVLNWVSNPRTGYQLYRVGQGHLYALLVSILSIAFVLKSLDWDNHRKVIINFFLFLLFVYLLGNKISFFLYFITTLTFLWFGKWKYLNIFIFTIAPLIFLIALYNFSLSSNDSLDILEIASYFDHYYNGANYYNSFLKGEINLYYGEVFLSSFWSYVPRAFYPDKPFVYGSLLINEYFFPGMAEASNTPAFGGAVDSFADFGIFGVVLFGVLNPIFIVNSFISYIFFRFGDIFLPIRKNLILLLILCLAFGPGFAMFISGPLLLVFLISVAITISQSSRLRI